MPRSITISTRPLLALIAVVALSVIGAASVVAATVKLSGGQVYAVKTATENLPTTHGGTSWANVPGMSVAASVPADQPAVLVITFSAEHFCPGGSAGECRVRAIVDGVAVAAPGAVVFKQGISIRETTSMQWVKLVSPGAHTVTIQTSSSWPLLGFTLYERTLTVLQSPRSLVRQ
jgi:hypothetical protein